MLVSSNTGFTNRFEAQVFKFIEQMKLIEGQDVLVAVSGGVDSMAALLCLNNNKSFGYSFGVRAIHINHGTRSTQALDEKSVHDYCSHLGIDLIVETLDGLDVDRNFEQNARLARYEVFKKHLKKNEVLVLGHHIDDSFEWSMMQSLRSSSLKGQLGIPVRNGKFIRPFMSVTRKQIENYAKAYSIAFIEDPTNKDSKYERNFIRNEVAPKLSARYPAMLKHYVRRQNELARVLGVHQSLNVRDEFELIINQDSVEIVSFSGELNTSGLESKILEAIKILNPNSRGSVSHQIDKIVQALRNHKKGPFTLSGGLLVYLSFNHLLVCKWKPVFNNQLDQVTGVYGLKEFRDLLKEKKNETIWPAWVQIEKQTFNVEFSKSHELWPDLFALPDGGTRKLVAACKLLKYWTQAKNKNKKLRLRLFLSL